MNIRTLNLNLLLACFIAAAVIAGCSGTETAQQTTESTAQEPVQLWTCGMHPQVIQDKPGPCPICGMALTPLRTGRGDGSVIRIDPVVVQNMGVRLATVTEGPLRRMIRAVGDLAESQPNQHDINLRVSGWVEKLYADTEGMHLSTGAPLFELYSPELQVGVEELIAARRARQRSGVDATSNVAGTLYNAAESKLRLLGLSGVQIERLARLEKAPKTIPFESPISGHLVEKMLVQGAAVKAGDRVMRIVDHGLLWLDIRVFEQDLPFVRRGQKVTARFVSMPGKPIEGNIIFIHPHVDTTTRAAVVRIEIENPALSLRPGMYATVEIEADLAEQAVLVPREAVIDTGIRQVAFVLGKEAGHFEPRPVTIGAAGSEGTVQILAGLVAGEQVVTSGQFFLDAESRVQEAIRKHLKERQIGAGTHEKSKEGGRADGIHAH